MFSILTDKYKLCLVHCDGGLRSLSLSYIIHIRISFIPMMS